MKTRLFILSSFLLLFSTGLAQEDPAADSIQRLINAAAQDSNKVIHLNHLAEYYQGKDTERSFQLATEARKLSEELGYQRGLERSYFNQGYANDDLGLFDEAIAHYRKSIAIARREQMYYEVAKNLNAFGSAYYRQGQYDSASHYMFEAIKVSEKYDFAKMKANAYANLGNLYSMNLEHEKALEYFDLAKREFELLEDEYSVVVVNFNKANVHARRDSFHLALPVYEETERMLQELNDKYALAVVIGNIGNIYVVMKQYDIGFEKLFKSLEMQRDNGDKHGMIVTYSSIGDAYFERGEPGDFDRMMTYLDSAQAYAEDGKALPQLQDIFFNRSKYLESEGRFEEALIAHQHYVNVHDSIFDENAHQQLATLEAKYKSKQQQQELELLREKEEERDIKEMSIIIGASTVSLLLLILAIVLFRNNRRKKAANTMLEEQNHEITLQKNIIEEKNKDITDSIKYAQSLQETVMPTPEKMQDLLPGTSLFFRPRDLVSGDFYWATSYDGKIYTAVADCTGHGVPGALVSMVGLNGLDRCLREFNLTDPGEILDRLALIVEETFSGSNQLRDGMDISLIAYDTENEKIQYAGANNPLWLFRHKDGRQEFIDVKANRQPVGKFEKRQPFKTNVVELVKGDVIWLFTDGLADQFGGPKGKKLKKTGLRDLLSRVSGMPISDRNQQIEKEFDHWKSNFDQLDDICVLGITV